MEKIIEFFVRKLQRTKVYICNIKESIYSYNREERRLRVFENRTMRRIFGPNRDENGEWRRLQNEELHSLFFSPNIMIECRRLRWEGNVARKGKKR